MTLIRRSTGGWKIIALPLLLVLFEGCPFFKSPSVLECDNSPQSLNIAMLMDNPNDSGLVELRTKYRLEEVVSGSKDDYEKLRKLVKWTHDQWKQSGSNMPSRSDPLTILKEASEGERFRCVEYAIVIAACARSLGMPSRVLALKREDVETASSNAGHVVAEVWLNQFNKWVFADAQFDAIPEINGVPLNAVEFQEALAQNKPGLKVRSNSQGLHIWYYKNWISPYLYYFDFRIDQRFFTGQSERKSGMIMLVPKGAKNPKVFQKKYPIRDCTYISNPETFYQPPI